jgi:hypothetical protein
MRALASTLLLAGCLSVPDGGGKPQCETNAECNGAAGEVCSEGVCWGDPPMGHFAATIGAPTGSTELASREITDLVIPADGWLGDLMLEAPVTLSGRVEVACPSGQTCPHTTLAATIVVKRDPLFYGGTGFRKAADSVDGLTGKSDSFSVSLPRSSAADPPYEITIQPADRSAMNASSISPAELVPPLHLAVRVTDDMLGLPVPLGGDGLPTISGNLTDAMGAPLKKYRVVAMGRWNAGDPPSEVSTVAYTTDGKFTLTLAEGLVGNVEVVARSIDPAATRATLRLGSIPSNTSTQKNLAEPVGLGNPMAMTVHVEGLSGNGEVKPLAGAHVRISGLYQPPLAGPARAELVADGFTDASGDAQVEILDGVTLAPTYKLSVAPPSGSNLAIVYQQPLQLVSRVDLQLAQRISLRGKVVDVDGHALKGVAVTAHPSLKFGLALDATAAAFLEEAPPTNATTPENGDFVVWVDPQVAQIWASYDLTFKPPDTVDAPTWTKREIDVDRAPQLTSQSLDTVRLPGAAWIHARITDHTSTPVAGAELQIFKIAADTSLCMDDPYCVIPAQLQGRGTSDDSGKARLTLPRE